MTRSRVDCNPTVVSSLRRGGVRGTGAASGSPPSALVDGEDALGVFGQLRPSMPLLLDGRQVAILLGIGRTKTFQLMLRGELPTIRIGRCVRVPANALANWIETHSSPAAGEVPRRWV